MSLQFSLQVWKYLIRPYWTSAKKWQAMGLLACHLLLMFSYIGIVVRINYWFHDFTTAIQSYDIQAFWKISWEFVPLVTGAIILFMAKNYFLAHLELHWQRWMINHLLKTWMMDRRYYRLQLMEDRNDNPDQRIAEDIVIFINTTAVLSLTLLQHFITAVTFFGILWSLAGVLSFSLGGITFSIPGYMCWGAILFSVFSTFVSLYCGKGLVKLDYEREKVGADFRYSLVRFRENTEAIALYQGESREIDILMRRFHCIRDNTVAIIKRMMKIHSWNSFFSQAHYIIPYLLAAPVYFAKKITFGTMMQAYSAFFNVSNALNFIVDEYTKLASWKATTMRLVEFSRLLEIEPTSGFVRFTHQDKGLKVACEYMSLPTGEVLQKNIHFKINPGEHTLISGPTGSGKSMLARVLAGLWPYGRGEIAFPQGENVMFLPQKTYLPLGSLLDILEYPHHAYDREMLHKALEDVGLAAFTERLDEVNDWSRVLSLGEQQRIAILRALLVAPDWLVLDEATSAVDEASQRSLYQLLKERLPKTTFISIAHRESAKSHHVREISLADRYTDQCLDVA